jgi:biotin operon repressor
MRLAIVLCIQSGYTCTEISKMLGTSKQLVWHYIKALRKGEEEYVDKVAGYEGLKKND